MKYTSIIAVVIVAVGLVWYLSTQDAVAPLVSESPAVDATSSPVTSGEAMTAPAEFTVADVAAHASQESCYSIIRGAVYDLTAWIPKHPGGPQKILNICGKDGTSLFEGKHGGNEKQENVLASFKIGELVQ